jgi:hypothetical protein
MSETLEQAIARLEELDSERQKDVIVLFELPAGTTMPDVEFYRAAPLMLDIIRQQRALLETAAISALDPGKQ